MQIDQYAKSATELFKLMLEASRMSLAIGLRLARRKVFDCGGRMAILLTEDVLDKFSLGRRPSDPEPVSPHPDGQTERRDRKFSPLPPRDGGQLGRARHQSL